MRTTSDMARDLPKVSDLPPREQQRLCVPQPLPCPEFLILPPKSSCPCSCTDHRPLSTPYKPLPSHPSFLRAQESRSLPGLLSPESLSVHLPDLPELQLPYQENGACGPVGVKDSVSWVSSSPWHMFSTWQVPAVSLATAWSRQRHLSHPTHPPARPLPAQPTEDGHHHVVAQDLDGAAEMK